MEVAWFRRGNLLAELNFFWDQFIRNIYIYNNFIDSLKIYNLQIYKNNSSSTISNLFFHLWNYS